MRTLRARPALRYGLIAAIANAALLGVDQAVRALNPAIIQAPQGRRALTIVFFSSMALVTLAVGYLSAHETGRVTAALWAGALAIGLPSALLIIYWIALIDKVHRDLLVIIIVFVIVAGIGALAGAIIALPGGLVGWLRYRQAHREELAERATARDATRQRRKRERLGAFGWLMVAAIVAVTIAPMGLSYLALNNLGKWEGLAVAVGTLLVSFGLLRLANNRVRWQGYLYDFMGLTLLVSGLIVGIAEITNYTVSLLAILGPTIFILRGAGRSFDRSLGIRKPSVMEPPELAPVIFRHDGESIVVYPSRLKLAGHALLFSIMTLVFCGLAVGLRSDGPTLVLGLGAFVLVFLLFCLIPDYSRLLRPWPTLAVTSDGIIDRGSGLITGFGLIPWHEIEGVIGGVSGTRYGLSYLWIIPANRERLLARQSRFKRPLLRLVTAMMGDIGIASLYLAQSPAEVGARIHEYVLSHAPASYFEDEDSGGTDAAPPLGADDPKE